MKTNNISLKKAQQKDLMVSYEIIQCVVKEVYPHYYPQGAVDEFLAYHSKENILKDILESKLYLIFLDDEVVGTICANGNEINRFFVKTKYQGKGIGSFAIDEIEKEIFKKYDEIVLDASLPGKFLYLKRGYSFVDYKKIATDNGDFLCFDEMKKTK